MTSYLAVLWKTERTEIVVADAKRIFEEADLLDLLKDVSRWVTANIGRECGTVCPSVCFSVRRDSVAILAYQDHLIWTIGEIRGRCE